MAVARVQPLPCPLEGAERVSACLLSEHTSLCFAAQARGGPGDHTPHAALRRVVRGLHAGLDRESFPRLSCVFISAISVEFG